MSFWTYMLRLNDGIYYTGHTDDLESRVAQHQSGALKGYTSDKRPLELVWAEYFQTRDDAKQAELQIKRWSRAKKEALITGDWNKLSQAAIPPHERAQRTSAALGRMSRLRLTQTIEEVAADRPDTTRLKSRFVERSRDTPSSEVETPQPAIVLVRPQLGENIGQAARAMLNFGLADLRLVSPRDGWPNPAAGPAAAGADQVLADARVFATVAEAVADCGDVLATTVRRRGLVLPALAPDTAATRIRAAHVRTAILFGAERSGLETDDVAYASHILTVPINPDFGSLNLAQAVILVAYEWSKAADLASPTIRDDIDPPAPHAELDGFIAQFDAALVAADYFHPPDRTPTTRQTIRTMLTKPGWSSPQVRALRGMLRAIAEPRKP